MVIDIQKVLKDKSFIDKEVTVCGWIKTSRSSKNFGFIELNDGSSFKSLQMNRFLTFYTLFSLFIHF